MDEDRGPAGHWDSAYRVGDTTRSWYQSQPAMSLRMLARAGVAPGHSVVDVGGGSSALVDALLDRGFDDVTVLDVSGVGLDIARRRLGPAAERVDWLVENVLTWRPRRTYQVWHDRAVLHFFTAQGLTDRYVQTLGAATRPGAVAVFATFAPDGPRQCSGLDVARYDAGGLADLLGPRWRTEAADREEHRTPGGAVQPFTWVAFRRQF